MPIVRTATVFAESNTLEAIHPSISAAKAAAKGRPELKLVKETEAPELFPPVEPKPEVAKAQRVAKGPTNITIHGDLTGTYTWAGALRSRLVPADPRSIYHDALAANTSFEAYFEAVKDHPKVEFVSKRGNPKVDTAAIYAKYAVRCGWVTVEGFDRKAKINAAKAENGGNDNGAAPEGADAPADALED